MKKFTKWALSGASMLLLAGSLAACGSGGSTSGTKEEVTMWGSWSGDQVAQLQKQIDVYNNSQDKYEVKYVVQQNVEEKLLTGVAGGELPDLIMWDRFLTALYAPKEVLTPIDELVAKDKVDTGAFYEKTIEEMSYGDQLYGLPVMVDDRAIFYNKDLLAEAGVQPPKTWDELEAAAKKLTKWENGKLVQSGFSLSDPGLFNIYLEQAGGQLVSDDQQTVAYNSPQGMEVLNFWDKLQNQDKVYAQGFDDGVDSFAAGTLAMKYDGPWALDTYNKVDGLNYGVVAPPTGPNGDHGAVMGGFGLVIPDKADNKDGAWDFMKWWTTIPENGVEFAKISGWMPANKVAAEDPYFTDDEYYSVFVSTLEYADIRPTVQGYSEVEGLALRPQLEKFLSGEVSAEQALKQAETEGNAILKENRGE